MSNSNATQEQTRDSSRSASSGSNPRVTVTRQHQQTLIGLPIPALREMVPETHLRQSHTGILTPIPAPMNDAHSQGTRPASDSTQLRANNRTLRAQNTFASSLLEEMRGVITAEPDGEICYYDATALTLFDVPAAKLMSLSLEQLLLQTLDDNGVLMKRFQESSGVLREIPVCLTHRDGAGKLVRVTLKRIQDPMSGEVTGLFLRIEDDSANRTDAKTGIANFFEFQRKLSEEVERLQRGQLVKGLSLLMFDLDHFTKVNTDHGHPAGDQVLRGVSRAIADSVRHLDTVARVGGEEMAVLMPNSDLEGALQRAESIRATIANLKIVHEGNVIQVTTSIGVATITVEDFEVLQDGERLQLTSKLYARADAALYAAKLGGRNRVSTAA